jgi:hypothetical protein
MRVLIGYEESGVVRRAFRAAGHNAWSCGLRPARDGSPYHIQADARQVAGVIPNYGRRWYANDDGVSVEAPTVWDLVIVHPPCTYLSVSGQHWNHRRPERRQLTEAALDEVAGWFDWATRTGARLALENPVGIISTHLRPATQYIQPYQFGDDASKKTGLWLVDLPAIPIPPQEAWFPPRWVNGRPRWGNQTDSGQNKLGPSEDRADKRAETYPGIARAMVDWWGHLGGSI